MATTKKVITPASLPTVEGFSDWDKLENDEQRTIKAESVLVFDGLKNEGTARITIGEHLTKMRTILEPKRLFIKFIDYCYDMSRATAYRYMEEYRVAKNLLPARVLEMAVIRHIPIREKAITQHEPPQSDDRDVINRYLDELAAVPAGRSTISANPDVLLKESVNFVGIRYNRVPGNWKTKEKWVRNLIGMIMTRVGMETATNFTPVPIPSDFVVTRGRPKTAQTVAA